MAVDTSSVLFFARCVSKIRNSLLLKVVRGNKESSIKNPFEMFMLDLKLHILLEFILRFQAQTGLIKTFVTSKQTLDYFLKKQLRGKVLCQNSKEAVIPRAFLEAL